MNESKPQSFDFIIEIAVEFWRLKKRFGMIDSRLDKSESLVLTEQIQRMSCVLEKYRIEIHDPKGEVYTDGANLKLIYIQDVDDLPSGVCRVIETVKPSVFYSGVVIFPGEVIVGQGKTIKSGQV